MVLRENIRNLSPKCLRKLREAFKKMQDRIDNRSFGYIAGLHGWPGELCQHGPRPDNKGNPVHLFLPWHRAYLYHFEKLLQAAAQDNGIGVPWWNWRTKVSASKGIPSALSDEFVNNSPNPLFKYHMNFTVRNRSGREIRVNRDTVRYPGPPDIPSLRDAPAFFHSQQTDVPDLYRLSDFTQFSERLRINWHNYIHGWVGGYISPQERGDMSMVQTEPMILYFGSTTAMLIASGPYGRHVRALITFLLL